MYTQKENWIYADYDDVLAIKAVSKLLCACSVDYSNVWLDSRSETPESTCQVATRVSFYRAYPGSKFVVANTLAK